MLPGDLVRYREFPHKELYESGCVGLVLEVRDPTRNHDGWKTVDPLHTALILWDRPRGPALPVNSLNDLIYCDYIEEIETL